MKNSIQDLRERLARVRFLLDQDAFLSFSVEERQSLKERSEKFQQRLDAFAEAFLTMGLLGGTGVGKSSLMNALAGVDISSTSHRRPHTEKVLLYRHRSAALPPPLNDRFMPAQPSLSAQGSQSSETGAGRDAQHVPWQEFTHEVDDIRQIILCDLPDFDSLAGEHRNRVLRFLENLDVLVWVASPEKYADGRFYGFLRDVPKARQNFYFVLNKVDLLFQDGATEEGYGELAKILSRFQQHLTENGIAHPIVYAVSAEDAYRSEHTAPWNQFPSFRHMIFQNRDAREVVEIKATNLDVEIEQFVSGFEKEMSSLDALQWTLRDFVADLRKERENWTRTGRGTFSLWLKRHLDEASYSRLVDPGSLVGPGYLIAVLIQEWRKWAARDGGAAIVDEMFHDDARLSPLRHEFHRLEDRIAHRILHRGLPSAVVSRLGDVLDPKRKWESLENRLRDSLEMQLSTAGAGAFRGFRIIQYASYFILFACFLLALSSESSWGEITRHPASGAFSVVSSIVATLFSPTGLAALGSFLLLYVFLGFRFYAKYKKNLQRRRQRFIESLQMKLERVWEEELDSTIDSCNEYADELTAQMSNISALYEKRTEE